MGGHSTQWILNKIENTDRLTHIRGGKMCQIVEGHNITIPQKSGGAREALFTNFFKKWGGRGPLGPPGSATPAYELQRTRKG